MGYSFNLPSTPAKARKWARDVINALRLGDTEVVGPANVFGKILGLKANGDLAVKIGDPLLKTEVASAVAAAPSVVAHGAQIAALQASQTSGLISEGLFSALSTRVGLADGTGGEVPDTDTGTHLAATATGYDGAPTANAGRYSYNAGWSRWVRIGPTGLSGKADKTAVAALIQNSPGIELDVIVSGRAVKSTDVVKSTLYEDPAGWTAGAVLENGTVAIEAMRVADQQIVGTQRIGDVETIAGETNYSWSVTDENDYPAIGLLDGQIYIQPSIREADLRNRVYARAWLDRRLDGVQQPIADYNSIVLYGQSLAAGQESWPAISTAQQFGNVMLGGDVRPQSLSGTGWTQVAPAGFQPLVARVRTNSTFLTDPQVAALAAGDQSNGEVPAIAMANMASWLIGRKTLATPKPFVVLCPAVGGMTIEQLSKVNGQDGVDRYSRFVQGVTQAHAAAVALGKTHVVTAIVWMQGEYDYVTTYGSTKATKVLYKAALAQLRTDMIADVKAITGQTDDPLFVLYQTGGSYTADADSAAAAGLHIGMAQLEFALENPSKVVMAGPVYPVTDKGGHLDSNGSRWFGEVLAKAYVRSAVEGRRFRPVTPIKIEVTALDTVRVHFFVPAPPLVFDTSYVVNTATDYAAKGFRVTDGAGAISVASATLIADTIVQLKLSRPIDKATGRVWYASKTASNGNGCLRDSDDALARDAYTYLAGSGMYAAANIAALAGKPYPLANWATAFFLPVGYQE